MNHPWFVQGNTPTLLHGADYNPEQWLDRPDILEDDIRFMKQVGFNVVSIGIFSWAALEPKEGVYDFTWLDQVIEQLTANDIGFFLATPTGARPQWMAQAYPEVLRVEPNRVRNLYGFRHNHCQTSPVFREKTQEINRRLSERYGNHPNLWLWHVSNEYSGECHCPLCQQAFRDWLKDRYKSLEALNKAWWTPFWSHTITHWDHIESPAPHGETLLHGLQIDWKRFVTHQTRDFFQWEIQAIRQGGSQKPVTTNLMGFFPGIDYHKLMEPAHISSWDSYPFWHSEPCPPGILPQSWESQPKDHGDLRLAYQTSATHSLMRGCKPGQPFLLMESTPSIVNWSPVSKQKRPGVHLFSSLLAVAFGSDSVQYFQWRKSRGASEKFHGAVMDHRNDGQSRVFKEVAQVGQALAALSPIAGSTYPAQAAVIYDWENLWALQNAKGLLNDGRKAYAETVERHWYHIAKFGHNVDMISPAQRLEGYKLLVAPLMYMVQPGFAEKVIQFVRQGGVFITTYWSGVVNETDLCFDTGAPGPFEQLLGLRVLETDGMYPEETRQVKAKNGLVYQAKDIWEHMELTTATSLAAYTEDYLAGSPAVTANSFGKGKAYYLGCRINDEFLSRFYQDLLEPMHLRGAYPGKEIPGIISSLRTTCQPDSTTHEFRFLLNGTAKDQGIPTPEPDEQIIYTTRNGSSNKPTQDKPIQLGSWGVEVRRRVSGR